MDDKFFAAAAILVVILALSTQWLHMLMYLTVGALLSMLVMAPRLQAVKPAEFDAALLKSHLQLANEHEHVALKLQEWKQLESTLNAILDLFIRDFIRWWYAPLNGSKSLLFENCVRSSLSTAVLKLCKLGDEFTGNGAANLSMMNSAMSTLTTKMR